MIFYYHLDIGQPNHLKTRQVDAILFSYVLVRYSCVQSQRITDAVVTECELGKQSAPAFKRRLITWLDQTEWSVFYIKHSLRLTIWNPNFKKLGFQMFGIQIPTVHSGFPIQYWRFWILCLFNYFIAGIAKPDILNLAAFQFWAFAI